MLTSKPTSANDLDVVAYHVKPGDNLTRILEGYHGKQTPKRMQQLTNEAKVENSLKNADWLRPGQVIKLRVPRQYCPMPSQPLSHSALFSADDDWFRQFSRDWTAATPQQKESFGALSPWILGTSSASLTTIEKTFSNNTPLLRDMVANYESYKSGKVTRGQYNYRRQKLVNQFQSRLGPTKMLLNGRKNQSEVLRVSRVKGTTPTQPITQQLSKMNKLSMAASRGGIALSVVGLGIACHQIAQTADQHKKNEILIESAGGLIGGIFFGVGAALAVALMMTPAGWVGALMIGAAGAAGGAFTGHAAKRIYNAYGAEIDLASASGVAAACNASAAASGTAPSKILSENSMSML